MGVLCAAYWLEEGGKGKVGDCSELLAEALSILQQYRAAPQLQADIKAAHEVAAQAQPPSCVGQLCQQGTQSSALP